MNRLATIFLSSFCAIAINAQTVLFKTTNQRPYPYRIPAIAKTPKGELVAVADYRPCYADIGFGRVDLVFRTSADNGKTWSKEETIIEGTSLGVDAGYGDACLVADKENNELLVMCVSGDTPYQRASLQHPQRVVELRANKDKITGKWMWTKPKDHTYEFYNNIFKETNPSMFMSSGKICQSSVVKTGKYYRLYAALCTRKGNFVVFSDDFGRSWNILGSHTISCIPKGDEVKCEEMPNGTIVLSSRKDGGRYFNVFTFDDIKKGTGSWNISVDSKEAVNGISNTGTPCNGEILLVKAKNKDKGTNTYVLLQSIPAGPGRKDVSIYYKDMGDMLKNNSKELTPSDVASNWNGVYKVTDKGSAYSTMCVQADKNIAFFYEQDSPKHHELIYLPISLDVITNGKYSMK